MSLTYPNAAVPKAEFVRIMREHAEADRLIAGSYGEGCGASFRGCAIGCGVQTVNRLTGSFHMPSDHRAVADALGIPLALAYLEDRVFEGLSPEERKAWPVRFAEAIPEGCDLAPAVPRILIRILREVVIAVVTIDEWGVRAAIEGVCVALETGEGLEQARAAVDAAASAAVDAVDAVDAGRAAWAAASAARAAAYAASAAVDAAAQAASAAAQAASAAASAAYAGRAARAAAYAAYAAVDAARAAAYAAQAAVDAASAAAYAAQAAVDAADAAAYRAIARIILEEISP